MAYSNNQFGEGNRVFTPSPESGEKIREGQLMHSFLHNFNHLDNQIQ